MISCDHAGAAFPQFGKRFCRNPSIVGTMANLVVISDCETCTARGEPVKEAQKPCRYRGGVKHQEPCSCGGAVTIPIYQCEQHKRCVATETERQKFQDKSLRRILKCCEGCPDFVVL